MDSATTKKSDKNFSKKLIDLNKNGSSLEASPTESTTTPVRFFLIHRVLKQWAMEFQWSLFRVYSEEKEKCTGGCWHLISKWRQKTEVVSVVRRRKKKSIIPWVKLNRII